MQKDLQCSPVFVPQITEGEAPLGLVMENESVRHCVAWVEATPTALPTGCPLRVLLMDIVVVEGPVMTKLLKSNLNWKHKGCRIFRRSLDNNKMVAKSIKLLRELEYSNENDKWSKCSNKNDFACKTNGGTDNILSRSFPDWLNGMEKLKSSKSKICELFAIIRENKRKQPLCRKGLEVFTRNCNSKV